MGYFFSPGLKLETLPLYFLSACVYFVLCYSVLLLTWSQTRDSSSILPQCVCVLCPLLLCTSSHLVSNSRLFLYTSSVRVCTLSFVTLYFFSPGLKLETLPLYFLSACVYFVLCYSVLLL